MTNHDEERIGEVLRNYLSQERQGKERSGCPGDEGLAGYLGGHLRGKAKEQLESHLADCSFCVDELVAAYKSVQEAGTETMPRQLIEKAMALVRPRQEEAFLDLVVRLAKGSLELISTTGRLIGPVGAEPVAVRGKLESSQAASLQVEKEMGRYKITAEVERSDSDLCEVIVGIEKEGGKPAEEVRVSLLSRGREQASYLTRGGRAVFGRVAKGKYDLSVSDSGGLVGTVRLTIR